MTTSRENSLSATWREWTVELPTQIGISMSAHILCCVYNHQPGIVQVGDCTAGVQVEQGGELKILSRSQAGESTTCSLQLICGSQ